LLISTGTRATTHGRMMLLSTSSKAPRGTHDAPPKSSSRRHPVDNLGRASCPKISDTCFRARNDNRATGFRSARNRMEVTR
jgi:hypothetical protein